MYVQDFEFSSTYAECMERPQGGFYVNEWYLFKEGKNCIPQWSQRKFLVQETNKGGLMGHFRVEKTLGLLKENFFWPHMRKDVQSHCNRCISCLQSKSKIMPHGLYTLLPIALAP